MVFAGEMVFHQFTRYYTEGRATRATAGNKVQKRKTESGEQKEIARSLGFRSNMYGEQSHFTSEP
jgi:hypothetical protein